MNMQNSAFLSDPIQYVTKKAINSVLWFMQNQSDPVKQKIFLHLNSAKEYNFDLQGREKSQQVILVPVGNVTHGDQPIPAYWCPFIQGNILPGFVDVPRKNPKHKFVFTAAMNGCSLVVTSSPKAANMIRVYHNQHPDSERVNRLIEEQGQPIISRIVFTDYGDVEQKVPAPNAFNFLYYENGRWRYVLQPQTFDMLTHDVALNRALPPVVRDV